MRAENEPPSKLNSVSSTWFQGLNGVPSYDELKAQATETDVLGVTVAVCSLEDLKAMKQASSRTRDQADLEDLESLS